MGVLFSYRQRSLHPWRATTVHSSS
ncbi:hypothetical protein A2U01_0115593, partial [Trifolium medium]|nr:hypothetical protein [Trifolium medium]